MSVLNIGAKSITEETPKLDPATVQIQVQFEENSKNLSMIIEGPGDYAMTLTSAPSAENQVNMALAGPDFLILDTKQKEKHDSFIMGGSVSIDRKTGAIRALRLLSEPMSYTKQVSFSGMCRKVNRTTNKF